VTVAASNVAAAGSVPAAAMTPTVEIAEPVSTGRASARSSRRCVAGPASTWQLTARTAAPATTSASPVVASMALVSARGKLSVPRHAPAAPAWRAALPAAGLPFPRKCVMTTMIAHWAHFAGTAMRNVRVRAWGERATPSAF
jgi:hypothetical protein